LQWGNDLQGHSRSSQLLLFEWVIYRLGLLLVACSNDISILHRFRDTTA